MTADGTAGPTVAARANHERVGNLFCESLAETNADFAEVVGPSWKDVSAAVMCTRYFFGLVATFLVYTYTIAEKDRNGGHHLADKSAKNMWGGLVQSAKAMHGESVIQTVRV